MLWINYKGTIFLRVFVSFVALNVFMPSQVILGLIYIHLVMSYDDGQGMITQGTMEQGDFYCTHTYGQ